MSTVSFESGKGKTHTVPLSNIDDLLMEDNWLLGTQFFVVVRGKKYKISEQKYDKINELLKDN